MKGVGLILVLCGVFNWSHTDAAHARKNITDLSDFIKRENIAKDSEELDFAENQIKTIDTAIFIDFPQLKVLIFDHNLQLKLITDDSPILESSSVDKFSCNECNITKIWTETFSKMPNLIILSLKRNGITHIEADAFENNSQLKELSLQGNQLRELPENLVESVALKSLHIDNNILYNFPKAKPCLISESLKNFTCSICGITEIYEETFSRLPNLLKLHLQKNDIRNIHEKSFSATTHLSILKVNSSVQGSLPMEFMEDFCSVEEAEVNTVTLLKQNFQGKTCVKTAAEIIRAKTLPKTTSTTTTTKDPITTTEEVEESVVAASVNPTLLDALIATYLLICVILEGVLFAVISLYLAKIVRSKSKEFDYSTSVLNPNDIYKIN